jgi:hypothetical protein
VDLEVVSEVEVVGAASEVVELAAASEDVVVSGISDEVVCEVVSDELVRGADDVDVVLEEKVVEDERVVEVDLLVVAGGRGLVVGGRKVDEGLDVLRDEDEVLDVLVLAVLVVLDVVVLAVLVVLDVLVCLDVVVLVLRALVFGPIGGRELLPPLPPPSPPLSSTGVVT